MKVNIVLDDTHGGIRMALFATHSGVQDHMQDSLACILAAQLECAIKRFERQHCLRVTRDANAPN